MPKIQKKTKSSYVLKFSFTETLERPDQTRRDQTRRDQFENFDIYKDLFGTPLSVTEVFKSSKFFKSKLFSWYTFINANIRAINITLKIIRKDKHLSANAIH